MVLLLAASLSPKLSLPTSVHASTDPITVYVGYADNLRPSGFFPSPWAGDPNTVFIGSGSPYDAGAIRIDNTGSSSITIDSVSVDLQRPGPVFNIWGSSIVLPAGNSLILTQTTQYNFDTSDYPFLGCGNAATVGQSPFPVVSITIGGNTQNFSDTAHVLDTLGYDLACQANESEQWRPIGTFRGTPELTLTPFNATNVAGTSHTLTATLVDNSTGLPISGDNVNFTVTGANTASGQCMTNTSGMCSFSYTGTIPGLDTIIGSALVRGVVVTSPPVYKLWTAPPIKVSKFFTDTSLNPLPTDSHGNPMVNVVLANGVVKSTNPGEIVAWVNVTNTDGPLQSLKINDALPLDWIVSPAWLPAKGAIHVFYANTASLATNPEITTPSMITVTTGNPQTVNVAISSFNQTLIGHPLFSGQSVLLSVKLDYRLDMTTQSAPSYPRNYTDTATAEGWSGTSYTGTVNGPNTGSASFTAYAKVVGDVNGDGKVDISDLALVGAAFGSTRINPNYNPAADVTNKGSVDITDLAIVGAHFGS